MQLLGDLATVKFDYSSDRIQALLDLPSQTCNGFSFQQSMFCLNFKSICTVSQNNGNEVIKANGSNCAKKRDRDANIEEFLKNQRTIRIGKSPIIRLALRIVIAEYGSNNLLKTKGTI